MYHAIVQENQRLGVSPSWKLNHHQFRAEYVSIKKGKVIHDVFIKKEKKNLILIMNFPEYGTRTFT